MALRRTKKSVSDDDDLLEEEEEVEEDDAGEEEEEPEREFPRWLKPLLLTIGLLIAGGVGALAGATVGTLTSHFSEVEEHLGRVAEFTTQAFVALNTAALEDGAYIHIPRNAIVEQPIHLLFISTAANGPDSACSTGQRSGSTGANGMSRTMSETSGRTSSESRGRRPAVVPRGAFR